MARAGHDSTGKYGGETTEKKLARLFFWRTVATYLGEERFVNGRYLALASAEGGDAMTLCGLGVPPGNIVLAENKKAACLAARKKVPLVAVYNEDVLFTAHRFPAQHFDAVFLDYCGCLTEECFIRSTAVAERCVSTTGVLGVGVHVGHEANLDQMPDGDAFERRARFIKSEMKMRIGMSAHRLLSYTAVNDKRHVPMCVYMGTWKKGSCTTDVVPKGVEAKALLASRFQHYDQQGKDVALIFNIPHSSIAPMRAHITRGTYK